MKKGKNELRIKDFVKPLVKPLAKQNFPEFKLKDVLQIFIGASILAVPVGFTEETWKLGETLPLMNVLGLLALSLIFVSLFTYYHYHRKAEGKHTNLLVKRTLATYLFSFIAVAIILGLIQKTPWSVDSILAFKRVIIVTFPASMSGAIVDTLK
jgi:uncharacterized membrane protein